MGKNKEVALDLVEHAHELRNAGIEPFVLLDSMNGTFYQKGTDTEQ
jgi:hypothetical protein